MLVIDYLKPYFQTQPRILYSEMISDDMDLRDVLRGLDVIKKIHPNACLVIYEDE